eukprot:TRINITY_DN49588_c0_g1_i1.p1 TRINITY_DN49588_c0_g1~~TRINITY_DN49588_c0_g1_i1.p1  ORF type:complete len:266 (-),score=50.35 TRINITY_DN49588_c0_g1_i1:186-911(-)
MALASRTALAPAALSALARATSNAATMSGWRAIGIAVPRFRRAWTHAPPKPPVPPQRYEDLFKAFEAQELRRTHEALLRAGRSQVAEKTSTPIFEEKKDAKEEVSLKEVANFKLVLNSPQVIDESLWKVDIPYGELVGPGISGKLATPCTDWMSVHPPYGTLDVRVAFTMDDGSLLYGEYKGRGIFSPEHGGVAVITPVFRTSSEKYSFLKTNDFIAKEVFVRMPTAETQGLIVYKIYSVD